MQPFVPLFTNPHLATIAGNYWKRTLDEARFPVTAHLFQTEPEVKVLVHSQRPAERANGEIILVHGLEGSSAAGYARSLAQTALTAGYAVHRFHMRSCGGTEAVCGPNLYHSGQTSDLVFVAREIWVSTGNPVYLAGFSLGGNVVLKLAGELGESAQGWIGAVSAVSTPIDLAACSRAIRKRSNFIYTRRFLDRLRKRVRLKEQLSPGSFPLHRLDEARTIWDFDDIFTAPPFGFATAANYYATQSSGQFLGRIRVPALLVQAKDDPMIPFEIYNHPAFHNNPHLRLIAPDYGGHLGFIARRHPRFWLDGVIMEWFAEVGNRKRVDLLHESKTT